MLIKFFVEKKQTIWTREEHIAEAESPEALEAKLKGILANGGTVDAIEDELNSFIEQEFLFDTIEDMTPADNDGQATIEVKLNEHEKMADFDNAPNVE